MKLQKRLAADIAKKSQKKVKLVAKRLDEIKEAITKADIRALIKDNAILVEKKKGVSRSRAKKNKKQKVRGRKKGQGSRKGRRNARLKDKRKWINRIRLQRKFLLELKSKDKLAADVYKDLYKKAKGGFFRSKRHVKLYIKEHKLSKK